MAARSLAIAIGLVLALVLALPASGQAARFPAQGVWKGTDSYWDPSGGEWSDRDVVEPIRFRVNGRRVLRFNAWRALMLPPSHIGENWVPLTVRLSWIYFKAGKYRFLGKRTRRYRRTRYKIRVWGTFTSRRHARGKLFIRGGGDKVRYHWKAKLAR